MATLKEDYARVASTMRHIQAHDVQVVDGVYVNFGYREALVLDSVLDQNGKRWTVTAVAWDRTGGVDSDLEIAVVREEYLPSVVRAFLDEQARRERELDEALASMNDEGGE